MSGYLAIIGMILLVTALVLLVLGGWVLTLFGLPGNWLILVSAVVYDLLLASDSRLELTLPLLVALGVLAVLGELVEFLAGAFGVARQGGSRLSAVLALVGSAIGGVAGAIVGLPVPVIGSIVAVLFFASLGALVGAVLGEDWKGRDLDRSLGVGMAAFWGRLAGTLAKTLIGGVMVIIVLAGLIL